MENNNILKNIKFLVMLVLGFIMIIKPNSLLSISIFILGLYLIILGFNSLVTFLIIIKHNRGWIYYCVKGFALLLLGSIFIFNTNSIVITLSNLIFILIGLSIFFIGLTAIIRVKEYSAGIVLVVLGLLILLFPLGVSNLITIILGSTLVLLSLYLIIKTNTKSS